MKLSNMLLVTAASMALSGCIATRSYVRKEVSEVQGQLNQTNSNVANLHSQVNIIQEQMKNLPELARDAFARAIAAQKLAEGKFVYTAVLTDNVAHFASNKHSLNNDAKTFVSASVAKLIAENKNVYVEIQGHTDKTGSAE